jgi:hypothetical protein
MPARVAARSNREAVEFRPIVCDQRRSSFPVADGGRRNLRVPTGHEAQGIETDTPVALRLHDAPMDAHKPRPARVWASTPTTSLARGRQRLEPVVSPFDSTARSDACPRAAWLPRAEEQIVDDFLVPQREPRELVRQRKDDMVIPTGRSSCCRLVSHWSRAWVVRRVGRCDSDTSCTRWHDGHNARSDRDGHTVHQVTIHVVGPWRRRQEQSV